MKSFGMVGQTESVVRLGMGSCMMEQVVVLRRVGGILSAVVDADVEGTIG